MVGVLLELGRSKLIYYFVLIFLSIVCKYWHCRPETSRNSIKSVVASILRVVTHRFDQFTIYPSRSYYFQSVKVYFFFFNFSLKLNVNWEVKSLNFERILWEIFIIRSRIKIRCLTLLFICFLNLYSFFNRHLHLREVSVLKSQSISPSWQLKSSKWVNKTLSNIL